MTFNIFLKNSKAAFLPCDYCYFVVELNNFLNERYQYWESKQMEIEEVYSEVFASSSDGARAKIEEKPGEKNKEKEKSS